MTKFRGRFVRKMDTYGMSPKAYDLYINSSVQLYVDNDDTIYEFCNNWVDEASFVAKYENLDQLNRQYEEMFDLCEVEE